ncbi:hypothetical protein ANOM_007405 [Aspergillus nomiae NRRL 13137]|uniref:Hydrophobin n=1 Tax=Aspergillus nomiae NRRL (strain ATCC 15546 / NRRL 13137 / CBS 260.88 / M93) TaxID=1509407 RepID=A0A0L1IXL4_ASPN3|nr:uncharacterized protein ANOM_007405 [Aspergillus nomiae NRRL 13137]KNG84239.1 hypothetical protein ANOM_007405 [Aspergillus nomiae NRRL 13137]
MRVLALCLALVPALAAPLNEPGSSDGINGYGNVGNNGNGLHDSHNGGNNGNSQHGNGSAGSAGPVCSGALLNSQAQCCTTGILNLANTDCKPASRLYSSTDDFKAACASDGRSAQCCSIPVAGMALLCNPVA